MGPLTPVARRKRSMRAFTLVEMLVVLVLLGIAAALLVPQLAQDDHRALEQEAQRLAGALEHAAAMAQWRGETLGMSAETGVYRFWRRDADGQWQVIADDDVLAARALRDGVVVRAERYAGAAVPADAILPLRPSGRNEPFSVLLAGRAWTALVSADPLNRVGFTVTRRDGVAS